MIIKKNYIRRLAIPIGLVGSLVGSVSAFVPDRGELDEVPYDFIAAPADTTKKDSNDIKLIYPFDDKSNEGLNQGQSPLYLSDPSNIKKEFKYDPETGQYDYYQSLGKGNYRSPSYMTLEEYKNYDMSKSNRDFWRQKSAAETLNESEGFRPQLKVKGELFDRIFGGNTIDIRPQGSAELSFGINVSRRDNPILPERQRITRTFDFKQKIQLNVIGNIGTKMKIQTSYNTEATFDFENQTKLEYTGNEDEIIQKIEAGNVSLPLQSSLITGSQTLFGVKTELQFGRLRVTSIFSQEKGEKKEIDVSGGAQVQEFEKSASDYEENKHYFLSHLFRESYESNLASPPRITSRINITAVEVYITNTQGNYDNTRNILAFTDLGNDRRISNPTLVHKNGSVNYTDNGANDLYFNLTQGYSQAQQIRDFNGADQALQAEGLQSGVDYERLENAIMLTPNEYTFNKELGYISLNRTLNPQDVLAVAYQYTYNGKVYQVGDLSTNGIEGQKAVFLKLLKGTITIPSLPSWDLMMKNVYSLDAFNIGQEDFQFNIWYLDPKTGVEVPYFPEGPKQAQPLITTLGLDRMSVTQQPQPDGAFDFIPNVTINTQNGRVYFPVIEPFGEYLKKQFNDPLVAKKYAYDSLYTTTKALAKEDIDHNRYTFKGKYQSSSGSEISLNSFNIPQGSVSVTAGGAKLTENVDYTVDYNLGRVKILNEGILASGQPIKVSLGSNSLFNVQTKTLLGSRFDYKISDDLNVGATVLNLTERPLTRKINIGDEPISNTVVGVDGSFKMDAPFLSRAADFLPFYSTKAKSSITVTAEAAKLFPGNSRAIGKSGVAYIDDFEGSQTVIDIRSANAWSLASTPEGQNDLFPEGNTNGNLSYGYNRAKLSWYTIDPLFFRNDSRTPNHIRNSDSQSNNYSREIMETEVFPNKDPDPGLINNLPTLDLALYPKERGPYNYETKPSPYSSGLAADGTLNDPASRWGGIMREIRSTDFEASNVEFIQFWIMDPFNPQDGNPNHSGGDLYFNIGSVSEDILKDSRKSFENGFSSDGSTDKTTTTIWGRVPTIQSVVNAFDNNPSSRAFQDIGLDGLNDASERAFYKEYLDTIAKIVLNPQVYNTFLNDPSQDNFHYYRGSDYDGQQLSILDRYKMFNGMEGNSPTAEQSPESYPTAATTLPDAEDLNRNFNLDRTESYYQYKVNLSPNMLQPGNVGSGYITDVVQATKVVNGKTKNVNWYQFKIPIRDPEKVVGNIRDFKSIRFMRMFLKGFNEDVVVRFAKLGLVRGEWRRYNGDDLPAGDTHGNEPGSTTFNISAVNLEENANRTPINYTIPPDIDREVDFGTTNLRELNEQSLVLNVCELQDGYTKFAYRNLDLDIRQYKRLKMFSHAEVGASNEVLNNGDVTVVVRLGTDFDNNYYEYEVPLTVTRAGENSPRQVWPFSNEINLEFDKLINAKLNRNKQTLTPSSNVSIANIFEVADGNNLIRIKGNPNLAEVQVIMIGVRNPRGSVNNSSDDGLAKCAEVWVNELRLSDFNNDGGWAAQTRLTAQVADLGTVNLSGSMSTPGWGSLEQNLNERQRETKQQYDLSASLDLAKLLPEAASVSIPMYYSVSENVIRPEYNPLDPDIKMKDFLNSKELSSDYKDSILKITDDYTRRRSINFTNVRKLPGPNKKEKNFYDIENLSFSYAYSQIFQRDINTKFNNQKNYRGGINYAYSGKQNSIAPFKELDFFKRNQAFKLIQDFNFNFVPSQISIQNQFDRSYTERQARNITTSTNSSFVFESPPFYQKSFNWSRNFSFRQSLTESITFSFNASNRALISEPDGKVSREQEESYKEWKREVWKNVKGFGDNTNYNHNFDLNYNLPLAKIPGLDFINASTKYSGTFTWDKVGNPNLDEDLGSTISNSQTKGGQATLNFDVLYNKFQYIRDLKNPKIDNRYIYKDPEEEKKKQEKKQEKKDSQNVNKADAPTNDQGSQGNKVQLANVADSSAVKKGKEEDTLKVKKFFLQRYLMDNAIFTMMSLKSISINYNETQGTLLPNYGESTNLLGMNNNWGAPGFGFVAGFQENEDNYLFEARDNDWLVKDIFVSGDFSKTYSKQLNIRATIRPVNGLRIQLEASQNESQNTSRYFFWDDSLSPAKYNFDAPAVVSGSYSVSYLSFNTSFVKDNEKTFENSTFNKMLQNRTVISQRLGDQNVNSINRGEYAEGYGSTSQEVILYSFLSAYSDEDPNKITLTDFTNILPKPNWSITYDGLAKIPFFKRFFKNITLSHRYRSTFSVGSYTRNPYFDSNNGDPSIKDQGGNFYTSKQLSTASIVESFGPLIGVDMTWENSLITRLEMRRDRNLSMSFNNNQLTEIRGKEYVIGLGYRISNLRLPFRIGKIERASDLDLRADFSIRDNRTVIRKVVEEINELTAGQRIFSIKFTADYKFSNRLSLRLFYDRVANTPLISSTFPTANTNAGISLRFTLSQ